MIRLGKKLKKNLKIPFWAIIFVLFVGGYTSEYIEQLMVQNNILNMQYNNFHINGLIRVTLTIMTLIPYYCGIKILLHLLKKHKSYKNNG